MAHARLGGGRWAAIAALMMLLAVGTIGQPAAAQGEDAWEYASVLIAFDVIDEDPDVGFYVWPDITNNEGGGLGELLDRYGSEGWELVDF